MKAFIYRQYGTGAVVHMEEVEKPTPAADQILVKVRGHARAKVVITVA